MASIVRLAVTLGTKSNHIFFRISSTMASEGQVMDLQARHATANLATPAIALQNAMVQVTVSFIGHTPWPHARSSSA
jgi:hypothetical protein